LTNPPDAELVEALRAGDAGAFKGLVEELNPALLRLASAHVSSRSVAEEVVGDTWIAVIEGIDRFEGRSALRTWIFQIALNKARTRGKRDARTLPFSSLGRGDGNGGEPAVDADRFQGPDGEYPGHWAHPPVAWSSPEERLASDASRDVMLSAIADLPPRQQEVLVMRDIQGLSSEEACYALGVEETNQRVLLHRARSKVRAALEEHFDEDGASE
jgi:RNA polymerase sigma-70 factor (ECF subfamily)